MGFLVGRQAQRTGRSSLDSAISIEPRCVLRPLLNALVTGAGGSFFRLSVGGGGGSATATATDSCCICLSTTQLSHPQEAFLRRQWITDEFQKRINAKSLNRHSGAVGSAAKEPPTHQARVTPSYRARRYCNGRWRGAKRAIRVDNEHLNTPLASHGILRAAWIKLARLLFRRGHVRNPDSVAPLKDGGQEYSPYLRPCDVYILSQNTILKPPISNSTDFTPNVAVARLTLTQTALVQSGIANICTCKNWSRHKNRQYQVVEHDGSLIRAAGNKPVQGHLNFGFYLHAGRPRCRNIERCHHLHTDLPRVCQAALKARYSTGAARPPAHFHFRPARLWYY